ncbi:glutaredoxin [Gammaproteobacteria bacterium SCGC AG-212-F23]|nr:glutaredoxin [Gammaproteobacteria bacterium SCGC AG-212-F23]
MAKIIIYSAANCAYCERAKALLTAKKAHFDEIRVDLDPNKRAEMERLTGRRTVPQIFINDQAIGGFDDLALLEKEGKLNALLTP